MANSTKKPQAKQANSLRSQMEETYLPERSSDKCVTPIKYNEETKRYFIRYLTLKAKSVLKFGYPDFWGIDQIIHFVDTIFRNGFIGYYDFDDYGEVALASVFSTDEGGVIMQNIFYGPKGLRVENPALFRNHPEIASKAFTIGVDCGLIRLLPDVGYYRTPLYEGIFDIIERYAELMALATQDLEATFINSQLAYVFGCSDKEMAETMKTMYRDVISGNPATFVGDMYDEQGKELWKTFQQNLAQNFIANEVLTALETLNDQFCTQIGIPNANTRKESGVSAEETNANNAETQTLTDVMVETLTQSFAEVSKLFDGAKQLTVEKRYKDVINVTKKEGENDDTISND